MADKRRKPSAFAIFIGILVVLLMLAIALFVYGSMTNGIPRPVLPGRSVFALRTIMYHG